MKPLLPSCEKLIPYLKRIDDSRVYSNFGSLNEEYCARLGQHFGSSVISCSSATSGLIASLMALGLQKGSFIACPSWTFCATPAAILMAGHIPYFVDVNKSGKVTEEILKSSLKMIDAAVVVSPCGSPIEEMDINIPIVVDAAGGFDTVTSSRHPSVVSTHATKPFGTGEGGFIICEDNVLLEKIRRITNFGLTPERKSEVAGFNAKLSEYHAAVGLAELDGWEEKRRRYLRKTKIYGLDYATSLVAVKTGEGKKGTYGCHLHPAFKDYPRTPLPVTEDLMKKVSFMPVSL